MSKKILRLLVIDDSPDDADAMAKSLRVARFMLKSQRVTDAASLVSALNKSKWDVVVAENKVHGLKTRNALDLVHSHNPDIPFIVYSREISDEEIATLMAAGVRDIITKARPARLIPAINRELDVVRERREYRRAYRAVKEMEEKHKAIVEGSREAVCYCADGMHLEVNQAYLHLFGYNEFSELEYLPILDLIHRDSQTVFKDAMRKLNKGIQLDGAIELSARKKDDSPISVEVSMRPVEHKGEKCVQLTFVDISKRKAAETRLQYLSQRDALTGLYNRHYFTRLLDEALQNHPQGPGAVIYISLYDLKRVTNDLGYTAGDRLLLKIAKLFRDVVGEDRVLARLGGEDFAILLTGQTEDDGQLLITKLQAALADAPIIEKGQTYECHSIASTVSFDASDSAQGLLVEACHIAEKALPKADTKRSGPPPELVAAAKQGGTAEPEPAKPAVVEAPAAAAPQPAPPPAPEPEIAQAAPTPEPEVSPAAPSTIDENSEIPLQGSPLWTARFKTALANNSFRLAYQPMINLHGDPEEFYEVLIRMIDESGQLLLPGEFMPHAEETGMLKEIDRWVVLRAIEALSAMHTEGRSATFFINLSAAALQDQRLSALIKQYMDASGLPPSHVVFELDEPVVSANIEAASQLVGDLADIGCPISIDNFELDVGSMLNLPRHTVKFVKINRDVVARHSQDEETHEQFAQAIDMIDKLDIHKVAKRVEDAASLSDLWSYGFEYVQGNYFQEADADTSYEFTAEDETELSSEGIAAHWSQ